MGTIEKNANPSTQTVKYRIRAFKIDLDAVDSYPQKIIKINSTEPYYNIEITTHKGIDRIKSVELKSINMVSAGFLLNLKEAEWEFRKDISNCLPVKTLLI